MTNNGKSQVFTLPVILYIVSQLIMILSMVSAIIFISFYTDTKNNFWLVAGLVLLLIANLGMCSKLETFTKHTKKEIYRLVLRTLVLYIFLCLAIFAILLENLFLGILALIDYIAIIYISFKQALEN